MPTLTASDWSIVRTTRARSSEMYAMEVVVNDPDPTGMDAHAGGCGIFLLRGCDWSVKAAYSY
eukprot:2040137-Pyramimonas_sp.AAC.1